MVWLQFARVENFHAFAYLQADCLAPLKLVCWLSCANIAIGAGRMKFHSGACI